MCTTHSLNSISILITTLLACFASLTAATEPSNAESHQELTLLNWSEYIEPTVVQAFEQQFKAKVKEIYFESDDDRDAMLAETDGLGYDLVLVNQGRLADYYRRGWLAQLDEQKIPNLRHIDPLWRNFRAELAGYGVPYFWGTTGIAYRADLVSEPITRWQQIYRPQETLRNKIIMIKSARETVGMALKALGYSTNSTDLLQLSAAETLLMQQKPFVKDYSYPSLNENADLVTGQAWATMIYNGDALALKEHHERIVYTLPEEGGGIWVDYLTVTQSSTRKALAMAFINFLNEPENAAKIARFVYFATPNQAAEKLLPTEFLNDPVIYPSEAALQKSEFLTDLPPRVAKRYNGIFMQLLEH
ncbi:MAG: spermidine/putrescine ABC transporter substrate-binding protein [Candidatus Competibacteraceae bacterium]|jgi:spermidine/putrescine transport system substrate-binding protein|nr:spermidine/putrescine ABC transporter substrate-binding protein [Candidatus Competibacteraceae bacterium]